MLRLCTQANHSFRKNAEYTLYTAHPVLGSIMSVVALKDLKAGSEVLCDYGYDGKVFKALNITVSDQECVKVMSPPSEGDTSYNFLFQGRCYDVGVA